MDANRAELLLMTYVAHHADVGYVKKEHFAWDLAGDAIDGIVLQTYRHCVDYVTAESRAAQPAAKFVLGLNVKSFMIINGLPAEGGAALWHNRRAWELLAAAIEQHADGDVFLDYETMRAWEPSDWGAVVECFRLLPPASATRRYFIYPVAGTSMQANRWVRLLQAALAPTPAQRAYVLGVPLRLSYRISWSYGGAERPWAMARTLFGGRLAPIAYGLDSGVNNWTADEIDQLAEDLPEKTGCRTLIWLPDEAWAHVGNVRKRRELRALRRAFNELANRNIDLERAAACAEMTGIRNQPDWSHP